MKLMNLSVENFRCFYGSHKFSFSTDETRNITLIHGENGTGKSALLNAILWCFFEKLTPKFKNKDLLLSTEAKSEGVEDYSVEIVFEHEGRKYCAQRKVDSSQKAHFAVSEIMKDHNFVNIPNPKNFMNSILPSDMADYFFFAGEGLVGSGRTKGGKFRNAVRDILGLTFAAEAEEDLKAISRSYSKQIDKMASESQQFKKLGEARKRINLQLQKYGSQRKDKKEQLARIEVKRDKFTEKLLNSGDKNVEELTNRIGKLEIDLKAFGRERDELLLDKQTLIGRYGWALFGAKLANESLDFLKEADDRGKIPSPYDEKLVKELISDLMCICGRDLQEGSAPYNTVASMVQKASTSEIRNKVHKAKAIAEKMKGRAKEFLSEHKLIGAKIDRKETEIGLKEQDLKHIEEELDGINVTQIQKDRKLLKSANTAISELNEEVGSLDRIIINLQRDFKKVDNELRTESANDSRLTGLQSCKEVVDLMVFRCNARASKIEQQAKDEIHRLVNDILQKFSRKDFTVEVTDEFEFNLVQSDGTIGGESEGEELLLNLAFISALIKYAASRVNAGDDFIIGGTVAPFIIDAPFGELDNTYKPATATFLPNNSEQLVFFLSSSHWEAVEESIREKIGSEYILVNHTRSSQGTKSSDPISILGKDYIQSEFNSTRNYTSIERILV